MKSNLFEISNDPQIIFYSCFGSDHLKEKYSSCVKVFYCGENLPELMYNADYYIGCERHPDMSNYLYFPVWRCYDVAVKRCLNRKSIPDKTKFCSFCVSNGIAFYRRELFSTLDLYKHVDSGGQWLNNMPGFFPVKDKDVFDSTHKFSLCPQNSIKSGYVTEKILQAYMQGCIPIYVGDPDIELNKKAFITGDDVNSIVEKVKTIDNNDDLYKAMLNEPLGVYDNDDMNNFLSHIVKENKHNLWKSSTDSGDITL